MTPERLLKMKTDNPEKYEEYKGKQRAYASKRRKEKPEIDAEYRANNRQACSKRTMLSHKKNPEKYKVYIKGWEKENPNNVARKFRVYAERHPDKMTAKRHKRRARIKLAGGDFTANEWFTLCFAVGFKCLCCDEQKPLTPDHVIPLSLGGTNWLHNIQPLCMECNRNKGPKFIDYREKEF